MNTDLDTGPWKPDAESEFRFIRFMLVCSLAWVTAATVYFLGS